MAPVRIRVDRIVDFGTIVSLVGHDIGDGRPVTVHVDHRPFQAFWDAWQCQGFPQPVEYDVGRLTLTLDVVPDAADG